MVRTSKYIRKYQRTFISDEMIQAAEERRHQGISEAYKRRMRHSKLTAYLFLILSGIIALAFVEKPHWLLVFNFFVALGSAVVFTKDYSRNLTALVLHEMRVS